MCNERTPLTVITKIRLKQYGIFSCNTDSERMANRIDPDPTAPSKKETAFIRFSFINKKKFV